jgi:hypothetical protein
MGHSFDLNPALRLGKTLAALGLGGFAGNDPGMVAEKAVGRSVVPGGCAFRHWLARRDSGIRANGGDLC